VACVQEAYLVSVRGRSSKSRVRVAGDPAGGGSAYYPIFCSLLWPNAPRLLPSYLPIRMKDPRAGGGHLGRLPSFQAILTIEPLETAVECLGR
jgi:hypothetical protein